MFRYSTLQISQGEWSIYLVVIAITWPSTWLTTRMLMRCGILGQQKARSMSSMFRLRTLNAHGWTMENHVIGWIMSKVKGKSFIIIPLSVRIFGSRWDIYLQTEWNLAKCVHDDRFAKWWKSSENLLGPSDRFSNHGLWNTSPTVPTKLATILSVRYDGISKLWFVNIYQVSLSIKPRQLLIVF